MRATAVLLLLSILASPAGAAEPAQLSAGARAIEAVEGQPPRLLTPERKPVAAPSIAAEDESEIAAPAAQHAAPASLCRSKMRRHHTRRAARNVRRQQYASAAGGIVIEVQSQLEPGQLSGQLSLFLEGRRVADFALDPLHPQGLIHIPLPAPGRLRYALHGVTDSDPRGRRLVDHRGCIDILPGGRYALQSSGRDFQLQPIVSSR